MMNSTQPLKKAAVATAALALVAAPALSSVPAPSVSTVGVNGYDLVSYHTSKKPLRGNGHHLVVHEGVTYLFSSESNKDAFAKSPQKYLPAYGGWCAYGVSVGKKFVGDPDVWEIVDGQLYLNLDNRVKGVWIKDVPGNIAKADKQWPGIRDRDPAEL